MSDYTSNNKRIARNTIVLYIRLILTIIVGLYSSRVILDALGINDFGLYNLVGGFVMMFSAVQAGLISASQRFINVSLGRGNIAELKHVFSTILGIYISNYICSYFSRECRIIFFRKSLNHSFLEIICS